MFVFALFNLQGTDRSTARAESFFSLAQRNLFVKNFFLFLNIFLSVCALFCAPCRKRSCIITDHPPFVNRFLLKNSKIFGASKEAPYLSLSRVIHRLRSGRNRRHFCGRPPRNNRRCLHPGMRRNYAPADSSAAPPLPGSWAGTGNS